MFKKSKHAPEVEPEPEIALTGIERHEQQESHQRTIRAQMTANKHLAEAEARLSHLEREYGPVLQEIESLRAIVRPRFSQFANLLNTILLQAPYAGGTSTKGGVVIESPISPIQKE